MKKVLVTGATGLLGREVMKALETFHTVPSPDNPEFDVVGTCFRRDAPKCVRLDLTDTSAIAPFLDRLAPDVVIHTAAERRPDLCDGSPDMVWALNVSATREIARWAHARGAFLIYLSTDYVFDGTSAPYAVGDTPNPVNSYGRSKLAGERAVLEEAPGNAAALRVPILYGPSSRLDESAAIKTATLLLSGAETVGVDHWATRYPTYTPEVAEILRQMTVYRLTKDAAFSGVYQWSGREPMTKYEMALAMRKTLVGMGRACAVPEPRGKPSDGVARPRDCHLDTSALEALGISISSPVPFAEGAASVLKQCFEGA